MKPTLWLARRQSPSRISDFDWVAHEHESPPYGETDVHDFINDLNHERFDALVYGATLRLYPKTFTAAIELGGYTYIVLRIPPAELRGEYDFAKLFRIMADRVEYVQNTLVIRRMNRLNGVLYDIAEKHHGDEPDFFDYLSGNYDGSDWH